MGLRPPVVLIQEASWCPTSSVLGCGLDLGTGLGTGLEPAETGSTTLCSTLPTRQAEVESGAGVDLVASWGRKEGKGEDKELNNSHRMLDQFTNGSAGTGLLGNLEFIHLAPEIKGNKHT